MLFKSLGVTLIALSSFSALAAPITYTLNKDHTDVTFRISHAGFTMKHGSFAEMSGTLILDGDRLDASSVKINVAMNSILTNHVKRDHDLQGSNFLDTAQFPNMTFVSRRVLRKKDNELDVVGDLTLHGVTREFTLHTIINKIGQSPFGQVQTAGFTATGLLKRSDYGMKNMIPLIGDDVNVEIDAEFKVESPN